MPADHQPDLLRRRGERRLQLMADPHLVYTVIRGRRAHVLGCPWGPACRWERRILTLTDSTLLAAFQDRDRHVLEAHNMRLGL